MKRIFGLLLITGFIFAQDFDWEDQGIPVRQGIHIEWQRTGDIGDDGEMIFCWSDTRFGNRDIFIQKVDASGNKLWAEYGSPVVIADARQEDPIVIADGSGGAFVMWIDYRFEAEDGDIFATHVNSEGLVDTLTWGAEGTPLTTVAGKQVSPNMSSDGMGGAFSIWNDESVSNTGHIYAQHLTIDGPEDDPAVAGFPVIASAGSHAGVSIEVAGAGFANMVWEQSSGENSDIYAQRIDVNLNTLWSTPEEGGIVVCDAVNNQTSPKVNDVSATVSAIVWEDLRTNPLDSNIYIQYVDADGNMLLENNGEVICDENQNQLAPRIKADENSTYIVWTDSRESVDNSDIYAQRHTLLGGSQWEDNGKPIALQGRNKKAPRLTVGDFGDVFIVWEDERVNPHPEVDIYTQHLTPDGTESFVTDGLMICNAENTQESPLVRPDGQGNAIIVWGDRRTGSYSLYVQHVVPESGISLSENGIEMYFGIDGNGISPKTLYLGNDRTLLYWTDYRLGGGNPITFGQIVDQNYNQINLTNGLPLNGALTFQTNPTAVLVGDRIFLNFTTIDNWGTFLQYYQILDLNLNIVGPAEGMPVYVADWQFDQNYGLPVVGEDGFVYQSFSDFRDFADYDVYVKKFDSDGNSLWADDGVRMAELSGTDDLVRSMEPLPGGGCIVVWQGGEWFDQQIFAQAVDGDGEILESWGEDAVGISTIAENQTGPVSVATDAGVFIAWKDSRNGNADVFGQYIHFDGTIQGVDDGFGISVKANDQQNPTLAYNESQNEVLVCWEDYENGIDFDILCVTVDLSNLTLSDEIVISGTLDSNETSPFATTSLDGTYMVIWEDTRNSTTKDIYYQEIFNGEFVFPAGGRYVCNIDFKQEIPGIGLYSETDNSYVIYWDDSRSSGKEDLINIYVQSRTIPVNSCGSMDVNFDLTVDILDIVMTVGFIMETQEFTEAQICAADSNLDGAVDILDIVTTMNYLLNGEN